MSEEGEVTVDQIEDYFRQHWGDEHEEIDTGAVQVNLVHGGFDNADVPLNAIEGFVVWSGQDPVQSLTEIRTEDFQNMAQVLWKNTDISEKLPVASVERIFDPLATFVKKYEDKIFPELLDMNNDRDVG